MHVKALVTGGAGLIGSHIADLLIENGHQVVILDSLAKPTHLKGRPDWINPKAEFILGDVRIREDWERALPGVDWVFHQAADGGFTSAIGHYFSNNSLPAAILYELIRDRFPVKKVITASSQAVYGEGKYACPGYRASHLCPLPHLGHRNDLPPPQGCGGFADIIHVMDEGKIVELGDYRSLLESGGRYAGSWREQMERWMPEIDGRGTISLVRHGEMAMVVFRLQI